MDLARSICLIPDPFWCHRFESLLDGAELEIYKLGESTSGKMVLRMGQRARKYARKGKSFPFPVCQTLLLSRYILYNMITASHNQLSFQIQGFSLYQHSF